MQVETALLQDDAPYTSRSRLLRMFANLEVVGGQCHTETWPLAASNFPAVMNVEDLESPVTLEEPVGTRSMLPRCYPAQGASIGNVSAHLR